MILRRLILHLIKDSWVMIVLTITANHLALIGSLAMTTILSAPIHHRGKLKMDLALDRGSVAEMVPVIHPRWNY